MLRLCPIIAWVRGDDGYVRRGTTFSATYAIRRAHPRENTPRHTYTIEREMLVIRNAPYDIVAPLRYYDLTVGPVRPITSSPALPSSSGVHPAWSRFTAALLYDGPLKAKSDGN